MKLKALLCTGLVVPMFLSAADSKKEIVAGEPSGDARKVIYKPGDTVRVYGQKDWESIVLLPSAEKIMHFFCGNGDDWTIHVHDKTNFAAFTPNKIGVRKTDLILIAASGNVYTYELVDVSGDKDGHADTQVLLRVTDDAMNSAMNGSPKYVSADEVAAFKEQAARAEQEAAKSKEAYEQKLQTQTDRLAAALPASVRIYNYDHNDAGKKPFGITKLIATDKFTYFSANAPEALSVYETKDGKPVAVNLFPVGDGTVRLDRVVEAGYFQIGKKRLSFSLGGE